MCDARVTPLPRNLLSQNKILHPLYQALVGGGKVDEVVLLAHQAPCGVLKSYPTERELLTKHKRLSSVCLLYTSDAADDTPC
eukprot:6450339-Pyramimonas_sp.AAC.1